MTMLLRLFNGWPTCGEVVEDMTLPLGPCIRRRWHGGDHLDADGARWVKLR